MRVFKVLYSGDYLDENGAFVRNDIGLDLLVNEPFIQTGFLTDQQPQLRIRSPNWTMLF